MTRSPRYLSLLVLPAVFACSPADDRAAAGAADSAAATATTPLRAADTAAQAGTGAMLDPNSATREQLAAVPAMTDSAAGQIVAGRPFADMTAVDRALTGLSEAQRDSIYARVWMPLDLNSAKPEEIELIPGVGPRMRHEFEEYRPYTSIEQFRREIGKYVDSTEVARLERYVRLR
jgi:DNA uptake protein ComE-like DNA-binding protein